MSEVNRWQSSYGPMVPEGRTAFDGGPFIPAGEAPLYVIAFDHEDEVNRVVSEEREACAKLCEELIRECMKRGQAEYAHKTSYAAGAYDCAQAIRARTLVSGS